MALIEGIKKIRVTAELDGGGENVDATPIISAMIQSMDIAPAYVDGAEVIQRGGDKIVAVVKEDDTFLGVNITLNLAEVEPLLKQAIVGGDVTNNKWSSPIDPDTDYPFPFRLEVWQAIYDESDSESTLAGYIEHEFSYCKRGRLGSRSAAQQAFSNEQYTLEARRNESLEEASPPITESAWTHDEITKEAFDAYWAV